MVYWGAMKLLAGNLRLLRQRAGLNQSDFAQRCGMSQATISLYERGQRVPSVRNLIRLVKALGVTTDELLGLSLKSTTPT